MRLKGKWWSSKTVNLERPEKKSLRRIDTERGMLTNQSFLSPDPNTDNFWYIQCHSRRFNDMPKSR